jgi:hypothetical protein
VSQDDVEHVRRDVEHYERTGEPLWEDRAPDFEVHDHDMPDVVGIYRGHDGWREWVAHFAEAWENFTIKALEFIDAGDGMVVEVVRVSAQGRASGVTVESIDGLVGQFETARRCGSTGTAAGPKPSKLWGWEAPPRWTGTREPGTQPQTRPGVWPQGGPTAVWLPAREAGNPLAKRVSLDGEAQNRTGDTTIFSRVLYQLSYLAEVARRW